MPVLQLIYAPNPIFKQKSAPVTTITDATRSLIDDLHATLNFEEGVGMAAPMVGVLERIIVVNIHPDGVSTPLSFINPEIIWTSDDTQTVEEASLCFRGISAPITRSRAIKMTYQDVNGITHNFEAEDFLATVIQHEIDYLDGIVFLDHLSRMKRDMLIKKMNKIIKLNPPHIHGAGCHH
jgi:peptide deformylase